VKHIENSLDLQREYAGSLDAIQGITYTEYCENFTIENFDLEETMDDKLYELRDDLERAQNEAHDLRKCLVELNEILYGAPYDKNRVFAITDLDVIDQLLDDHGFRFLIE
jgi:Spy/CpxP family protein refolding chaperone